MEMQAAREWFCTARSEQPAHCLRLAQDDSGWPISAEWYSSQLMTLTGKTRAATRGRTRQQDRCSRAAQCCSCRRNTGLPIHYRELFHDSGANRLTGARQATAQFECPLSGHQLELIFEGCSNFFFSGGSPSFIAGNAAVRISPCITETQASLY